MPLAASQSRTPGAGVSGARPLRAFLLTRPPPSPASAPAGEGGRCGHAAGPVADGGRHAVADLGGRPQKPPAGLLPQARSTGPAAPTPEPAPNPNAGESEVTQIGSQQGPADKAGQAQVP